MHLPTLIDDSAGVDAGLVDQHGLSLLIEACDRTVLFDMGQDGAFIRNAEFMGLDLTDVDLGILSHGHFDHGGGLAAFLSYNTHAPVYIRTGAGNAYYARDRSRYRYVGLDTRVLTGNADRLIRIGNDTEISPGLMLITGIPIIDPPPPGNRTLLVRRDGRYDPDPLLHELFLVVAEKDSISIVTGCGHSGLLNMVHAAKEQFPGRKVKAVVGGFHLTDKDTAPHIITTVGKALKSAGCRRVIAGHCTGSRAKDLLREEFGDRFSALFTGFSTEI